MKQERITQAMLKDLKPKGVLQCELPSVNACYTARSQCAHVKRKAGYQLTCHIDFENTAVTIIRLK